jgi:hypothetical protein
MNVQDEIKKILSGQNAESNLLGLVKQLKADGVEQQTVYRAFEQARARLRGEDQEGKEDAVMNVMDVIVGWCRPSRRIWPTILEA